MAYVAKHDIIAFIENEINFIQGNSQTYEIILYKDFVGSPLNLNQPTLFTVAIYVEDRKVLQYSKKFLSGVSLPLLVDTAGDTGVISFEIDAVNSLNFGAGRIYAQIGVHYENYFPKPKSYIFPRLAIGEVIDNGDNGSDDNGSGNGNGNGTGNGNGNGSGDNTNTNTNTHLNIPEFIIEHTDGTFPSQSGNASVNSFTPSLVTSVVFKNLDKKNVRISSLENFLVKRISVDGINGAITLKDTVTCLYGIYKIVSWQRLDFSGGNGLTEDTDGIKINVEIEAVSTGAGVSTTVWQSGQIITYELDAHGSSKQTGASTGASVTDNGELTYTDTNVNPTTTTGDYAATGVFMTYTPYHDSYVIVEVNGISVRVGDANKNVDSYFSGNGGSTAVPIDDIRAGDELYWNGSSAGYNLTEGDSINLIYEAKSTDLD